MTKFLRHRGPDLCQEQSFHGYCFIHTLLAMTGEPTPQPFFSGTYGPEEGPAIVCLFNGEIYNYHSFGDYPSDGYCLIPLYQRYGPDFVHHLDGEFALCLMDFAAGLLIVSTDVFGTKPLWLGNNLLGGDGAMGALALASYQSALTALGCPSETCQQCPANTTLIYRRQSLSGGGGEEGVGEETWSLWQRRVLRTFDLRQFKTTYDDWIAAFERAVKKRVEHGGERRRVFLGLSSGHDSGAICAALIHSGYPYLSVSLQACEDLAIVQQRMKMTPANSRALWRPVNHQEWGAMKTMLHERCEPHHYHWYDDKGRLTERCLALNDVGAVGTAFVVTSAQNVHSDYRIMLSGMGGDEIYGKENYLVGKFPEDLQEVWPWKNALGGSMANYLNMSEAVAGGWGAEGRYPLIDPEVVQEYLWLLPALKNQPMKGPIDAYLQLRQYPINPIKKGFNAQAGIR